MIIGICAFKTDHKANCIEAEDIIHINKNNLNTKQNRCWCLSSLMQTTKKSQRFKFKARTKYFVGKPIKDANSRRHSARYLGETFERSLTQRHCWWSQINLDILFKTTLAWSLKRNIDVSYRVIKLKYKDEYVWLQEFQMIADLTQ